VVINKAMVVVHVSLKKSNWETAVPIPHPAAELAAKGRSSRYFAIVDHLE